MSKIEISIKCSNCKTRITELNDENSEKVTTYDYCVYCSCGNEILYTPKR